MELKVKKKDVPIGKLIEVSISPKIIMYFDGKKYFVTSGTCPHAKWPLELGTVKKNILTCGGHGWGFDITNGNCTTNPGRDLLKYDIIEKNDEIEISLKK